MTEFSVSAMKKLLRTQTDKFPNEISGRFTELKEEGLIEEVGRRDGHTLYEVTEQP